MGGSLDLQALIEGGELDRDTLENLRAADPEEMRALLATYLPEAEVEQLLARIQKLIEAADAK